MIKYAFLDIDGVLNCHRYFVALGICTARHGTDEWVALQLDPAAVGRLNAIIDATGAEVVISSSWRLAYSQGTIARALRARGFLGKVISMTGYRSDGDSTNRRGFEIQDWLDANAPFERRLVILDDSSDFGNLLRFHVKTSWLDGLLDCHVPQAINMLNEGP